MCYCTAHDLEKVEFIHGDPVQLELNKVICILFFVRVSLCESVNKTCSSGGVDCIGNVVQEVSRGSGGVRVSARSSFTQRYYSSKFTLFFKGLMFADSVCLCLDISCSCAVCWADTGIPRGASNIRVERPQRYQFSRAQRVRLQYRHRNRFHEQRVRPMMHDTRAAFLAQADALSNGAGILCDATSSPCRNCSLSVKTRTLCGMAIRVLRLSR